MFVIPFSLLWCGFAIFWTIGATNTTGGGPFPLFGLLFVCIGLYFVFGRFLVDAWARSSMYYAVTDRRILIIRSRPTNSFTALNIAQLSEVDINERADGRGTILFGRPAYGDSRNTTSMSPAFDHTPQFLAIEDARRVFDLIQKKMAP
ncbi:PH domain-containing protein [Phyllobacterium meliloti]|nr:PH domain-containing protein [Phyllobacterium sp. T1293]UGX87174.1 PH domain-containing protein [Phyllobacterium sp. T1293]